jgi:mannose-6-phosphate isomerase-like protein (cupin superfamily)
MEDKQHKLKHAKRILLNPNFKKLSPQEVQDVYRSLMAAGITKEEIRHILEEKPFTGNIEELTQENDYFRRVVYTAEHQQLVVMKLNQGEDIGMETHPTVDQFIRIEEGFGYAVLNGVRSELKAGSALLIPAGTEHNVVATSVLKLYTIYSPPNHPPNRLDPTKPEND